MSYCRFSDMSFTCDAYVYESCNGGYDVFVARNRPQNIPPHPGWKNFDEYINWMDLVSAAERIPINGPLDGEYRNFLTPGETADFLEEMRSEGYNVPQYAIDALRDEAG